VASLTLSRADQLQQSFFFRSRFTVTSNKIELIATINAAVSAWLRDGTTRSAIPIATISIATRTQTKLIACSLCLCFQIFNLKSSI
jgi:hypothetical protein